MRYDVTNFDSSLNWQWKSNPLAANPHPSVTHCLSWGERDTRLNPPGVWAPHLVFDNPSRAEPGIKLFINCVSCP